MTPEQIYWAYTEQAVWYGMLFGICVILPGIFLALLFINWYDNREDKTSSAVQKGLFS